MSAHHCARLRKIGVRSHKLNLDFATLWNKGYPDDKKDYDNPLFKKVETLYSEGRDMAIGLMDLSNLAERLNDYIGKSIKKVSATEELNNIVDLKPNFFGIGININAFIKRFLKK